MNEDRDDGKNDEDVDEPSTDVKGEKAKSPADQKNDSDRKQHDFSSGVEGAGFMPGWRG